MTAGGWRCGTGTPLARHRIAVIMPGTSGHDHVWDARFRTDLFVLIPHSRSGFPSISAGRRGRPARARLFGREEKRRKHLNPPSARHPHLTLEQTLPNVPAPGQTSFRDVTGMAQPLPDRRMGQCRSDQPAPPNAAAFFPPGIPRISRSRFGIPRAVALVESPDNRGQGRSRAVSHAAEPETPVEHPGAYRSRFTGALESLLAEKRFPKITIGDLVGRAHTSRRGFYEQFDSKEACLLALLKEAAETGSAQVSAAVDRTAPWQTQLRQLVTA